MPRNKLYAEWFWIDRWMSSSAFLLPMAARGLYREMLSQAWFRGAKLPNDHEMIKRAVAVTDEEWDQNWPLISKYFREKNGTLFNQTQVKIYRAAKAIQRVRSSAGRLGGLKSQRVKRQAKTQANTQANQPPNTEADGTAKINPLSLSLYTDLPRKEHGEDLRAPARPRSVQGSGAGAGTFPRDHLKCSQPCGRVCLPEQLFAEFVKDCGGRYGDPDAYVRSWHRAVDETWGEGGPHWDTPVGDDKFAFWRARWRDDHGSTARSSERTQTPEEMAASVKRMLDEERAHKVGGRR